MNKSILVYIISLGSIIILMFVFYMSRKHTYPSVIDSSSIVASNVNFSVELLDNEKKLVCHIENNNNYEITYGEEYYLEIEKDGTWYEVTDYSGKRTNEKDWIAIAYIVRANDHNEFDISLDNYRGLSDGNYRIVKYVFPSRAIIVAPFQLGSNKSQ